MILLFFYSILSVGMGFIFSFWILNRLDASVHQSSPGFRFIIMPGIWVFWPFLLFRLLKHPVPYSEWNAHRRLAGRSS